MQRSESRQPHSSQFHTSKLEVQLPRINRTSTLRSKDNNQAVSKTAHSKETHFLTAGSNLHGSQGHQEEVERVRWVIEEVDYSAKTNKQIEIEYRRLRKQLLRINQEVAKSLEKLDRKIITRKQRTSEPDNLAKLIEVSQKETHNNTAHIEILQREYNNLQKRLVTVSDLSAKENIHHEIALAKEAILKTKTKIRGLEFKNKSVGQAIMNADSFLDEMKKLEQQREMQELKKLKTQAKIDQLHQQISTSELKLSQIEDQYLLAHAYFQDYSSRNQQEEHAKLLEKKLCHAKHDLEIIHRKKEGCANSRQQRYHLQLKSLSAMIAKVEAVDQKISTAEMQILHKKQMVLDLEEMLNSDQHGSSRLIEEPMFFTEPQENRDGNSETNNCGNSASHDGSETTEYFSAHPNHENPIYLTTIHKHLRDHQLTESQDKQAKAQDQGAQLEARMHTQEPAEHSRLESKHRIESHLQQSNQLPIKSSSRGQKYHESDTMIDNGKQKPNGPDIEPSDQPYSQKSRGPGSGKTRPMLRLSTNQTADLEEEQDQIMDLDEKFNLNHKTVRSVQNKLSHKYIGNNAKLDANAGKSNDGQIEFCSNSQVDLHGSQLDALEKSNDKQLTDFKEKVAEQKKKSKNNFDLDCDSPMRQVQKFINSIDGKKSGHEWEAEATHRNGYDQ